MLEIEACEVENLGMLNQDGGKWSEDRSRRGGVSPCLRAEMCGMRPEIGGDRIAGVGLKDGRRADRRDLPLPLIHQQYRRNPSPKEGGPSPYKPSHPRRASGSRGVQCSASRGELSSVPGPQDLRPTSKLEVGASSRAFHDASRWI